MSGCSKHPRQSSSGWTICYWLDIHASLLPGGLFVTGSNYDAGTTVNGGVYERTAIGFKLLWSSGSGSQVDEILANFGSKVIDHIGVVF